MALTARHGADVSGTEPSPSIWSRFPTADCLLHGKGILFWDDFRSFDAVFAVASNIARYGSPMGSWISYEDTGDAVTQLATDSNGVVNVAVAATNNNESWLQAGSATSVSFLPKTRANGGTSIFFECRVNTSTLVGNGFVGLAEEGSAVANFQADSGGTMADKDFIGFSVDEDTPTVVNLVYGKQGGTAGGTAIITGAHTLVADTFVKLGFIIDMDESDANKRVKGFVNGVEQSTYLTDTLYGNTTNFPTGEELGPIFGGKNNNAAKVWRMDWIRVGQLRSS